MFEGGVNFLSLPYPIRYRMLLLKRCFFEIFEVASSQFIPVSWTRQSTNFSLILGVNIKDAQTTSPLNKSLKSPCAGLAFQIPSPRMQSTLEYGLDLLGPSPQTFVTHPGFISAEYKQGVPHPAPAQVTLTSRTLGFLNPGSSMSAGASPFSSKKMFQNRSS